ncbi:MAG TPA: chemotaxis protein CheB [Burkholderiales bacterium]
MTQKSKRAVPASAKRAGAPKESLFPIVGVGASAGGLEAFKQFLSALPRDTGMAFVLVQHLAPTHASMLADILSRETKLPVAEVKDEPAVRPNRVYVIPPDRSMTISGGVLQLQPRKSAPAVHHPVDQFLGSLARDRGHQAIGVILSGTANDGTAGMAEIKAAGGITFAQDDTAEHRGMPRSAIAAGCVDFILPPEGIARKIAELARHPHVYTDHEAAPGSAGGPNPAQGPDFARVLELLHQTTGVNFGQYKTNTLQRRITRRMAVAGVENPAKYLAVLKQDHDELTALYQDILIGVTHFFRNREAFEALRERVLPALFKGRAPDQALRVWVLGCSSGEEAYSLAIVLAEFAESRPLPTPIQLFATDLNGAALEKARAGIYPRTIVRDVSPERIRRFFVETDGHYRVTKQIRDMCVFAQHNVLADPPFSRMDIITCRNLLIYLEPAMQQKILPLLHYALNPGGVLVLGSSETVGGFRDLFEVEDTKQKIFLKKPGSGRPAPSLAGRDYRGARASAATRPFGTAALDEADLQKEADRLLLTKYAPAGVLVDENLEIMQFRGDTGVCLTPGPGKASHNLLKMAREGLLVPLRAVIARARKTGTPVREEGVRVKANGGQRTVDVEVIPLKPAAGRAPGRAGLLILFQETGQHAVAIERRRAALPRAAGAARRGGPSPDEAEVARLTQELAVTREYLQSVIDQQEVINEELQSANEEVQSANEELQSTNEELETSKEEIQSSNEELATVNDELQHRNRELGLINSDLVNLLDSVQMPIIMVGHDLRIRRFTPMAERILGLIPADLGRPMANINLNLSLGDLQPILLGVMDTLATKEVEVQDKHGTWYSLRIRPYRTLDNKIDGAVLTLIDVDTLRRARQYAQSIVATVREPMLVLDGDLRVRTASRSFYQTFQCSPAQVENRALYDLAERQWNIPELRERMAEVLRRDLPFEDYEMEAEFPTLGRKTLRLNARRLVQDAGAAPLVLLAIEDVSERTRLASDLEQRVEELAAAHRSKDQFLAVMAHELRNPLAPLHNAVHLLKTKNNAAEALPAALPMMERQIRNLPRLVDDLLDVSRITRGKVELQRERVRLGAIVASAVEAARPVMGANGLHLSVALPPQAVYVDADPTRLEQILGNLLNNAAKFTRRGGHVWLSVATAPGEHGGREAVIRVKDDGIGISEDTLPRVFDLFVQADRSLERAQGGLGIGLTLVRSLVELHGGRVEGRSAGLGKGSEFIVHLPILEEADETSSPQDSEPAQAGSVEGSGGSAPHRVLVVDDNEDSAHSLAELLSAAGHEVKTARDGAQTFETVAAFRPEVILLDIGLPGMDGYEVARRVRRQSGNGRALLIALTGYGRDEDRRLSQEAGFDYHLTKPVDLQKLKTLLAGAPRER